MLRDERGLPPPRAELLLLASGLPPRGPRASVGQAPVTCTCAGDRRTHCPLYTSPAGTDAREQHTPTKASKGRQRDCRQSTAPPGPGGLQGASKGTGGLGRPPLDSPAPGSISGWREQESPVAEPRRVPATASGSELAAYRAQADLAVATGWVRTQQSTRLTGGLGSPSCPRSLPHVAAPTHRGRSSVQRAGTARHQAGSRAAGLGRGLWPGGGAARAGHLWAPPGG